MVTGAKTDATVKRPVVHVNENTMKNIIATDVSEGGMIDRLLSSRTVEGLYCPH
jgi:hypothetical protein